MYITILYCDTCMILTRSIFFCFQILGKQLPLDFPIVFPLGQPSVTRESPGFSQGRTVYDDLVQEPVGAESGVIVAYAECRRNNHWSWITSGCKVLTYFNLIFLKIFKLIYLFQIPYTKIIKLLLSVPWNQENYLKTLTKFKLNEQVISQYLISIHIIQ